MPIVVVTVVENAAQMSLCEMPRRRVVRLPKLRVFAVSRSDDAVRGTLCDDLLFARSGRRLR